MSAQDIASAFVKHYYENRGTNPQALAGLYQAESTVTAEKQVLQGPDRIIAYFAHNIGVPEEVDQEGKSTGRFLTTQPPTSPIQFNTPEMTLDCQPGAASSLLIFVTGQLSMNGSPPIIFSIVPCF